MAEITQGKKYEKDTIHRRVFYLLLIIFVLQLTGCSLPDEERSKKEPEEQSMEQEQNTEENKMIYSRSEAVVLDTDMDFEAMGVEYFDEAVELYQDEGLTDKIYCQYEWNKEGKTLSLHPPTYPLLNVSTVFASKELLRKFAHSDYYFFEKGENQDWGNLGKMYLVRWLDLQTGDVLEKPEITEVFIKGELDTPKNFRFGVSEYGNGILSWEPVEGAERYLIVAAAYQTGGDEISGFYQGCDIVAETTNTDWQAKTRDGIMNEEFLTLYDAQEGQEYYYGVIAIRESGTSMLSSMISKKEMAKRLPYWEKGNGDEEWVSSTRYAESIALLSRYQWIQLCDGTLEQRFIYYHIDEAEIVNVTDWGEAPAKMIQLPYTVEGTDFNGTFYIKNFDETVYREDLKNLQERQEILKSKMSGMLSDVLITVKPEHNEKIDSESINCLKDMEKNRKDSDEIGDEPVATTELSRYLAHCLLKGREYISISDMQDKPDQEALIDAFYEAYYQNPNIPAVKELSISHSGEELYVIYEEDVEEREKKQKEVMEQVHFIAGELMEEGMSEVDKVLAINAYLCDTVDYDEETAKQSVDGKLRFSDSMTPYGAFINKKGVCLAYAGSFQLLAKEMGLDSIVVTGVLNGNQNHAWNKVNINGEWCVVDVTSNDGPDMRNIALNISDEMAGLMLKEDDRYLCDENMGRYPADTEEFEYYHLAGKYYGKDEIAGALVKELTLNEQAVLRTDITLTNEEFQIIVKEVMDDMEQMEMQGYYRLGVIYLGRKEKK